MSTPRFRHDRSDSIFMGRDGRFDTYVEPNDDDPLIVLRYSSDPSDRKQFTYRTLKTYPFIKFANAVEMYERQKAYFDMQLGNPWAFMFGAFNP